MGLTNPVFHENLVFPVSSFVNAGTVLPTVAKAAGVKGCGLASNNEGCGVAEVAGWHPQPKTGKKYGKSWKCGRTKSKKMQNELQKVQRNTNKT
jgi:hypothetical protein